MEEGNSQEQEENIRVERETKYIMHSYENVKEQYFLI